MDNHNHVKVKSRWTQFCQMNMEESQSSLEMSDSITDVSSSDLNENTDHSFELNSLEITRSSRTSRNRTNYRQFSMIKTTQQKNLFISNNSNKNSLNIKQSLRTPVNGKKDNVHQEPKDIIEGTSVNWNHITIYQTREKSKSCNDISRLIEKCPSKPIRRTSLSWEFTFTSINEGDNYYNLSNTRKHLNKIKSLELGKRSLSTNYKQLCKEEECLSKINVSDENISQKPYYIDIDALNGKNDDGHTKVVLNMNNFEISKINSNKQEQFDDLNKHVNHSDTEKIYKFPKSSSAELGSSRYSRSIYKYREIRSKSLDFLMTKTKSSFKRSNSCDDIKKLENSVVTFKLQKLRKHPKKKRRQSKRIKPKIKSSMDMFDDVKVPEVDYNQEADIIFQEHKNQLLEAQIKDKEFDQKLKSTNFTLVNENLYQPDKQTLKCYQPYEISALRKLKKKVTFGDINEFCECTLSKDEIIKGHTGCNDRCLNRLLKVECGSGCRLKQYCTNKRFQNKQFKKTSIIKTENKGYGICAVEDIPKGVLISEYVGEVIDYNEMCNRLTTKEYANQNYMVQLNSDEIIDSTSKGNVTRFINHSCDPNSVGEKWHVLGQSRIGFFSTRHINKGEEITFDYSFQVFGDGAQINCYCGSPKCRGYINKSPQITGLSCSEDSDDIIDMRFTSRSEESQRKNIILKKKPIYNDSNKLRELSRQLTEIAKLKTGLKPDQEMATLNLNRLMVHIADSFSRLHVLTFIQKHDMNKRLFMDFSGLSIIHNWMTSNKNDESFKLMILDILADLPITNRNTITKSKVLDVVAEWAEIPEDIKSKIESLDYPSAEFQKHSQEVENILPKNNEDETINILVEKSRALWKKWIILKMVFKIPKKIDQNKVIEEIDSNEFSAESYASAMYIPVLDEKRLKMSNSYINKVYNKQNIALERIKLRKEYELKNDEQERPKIFRKKVIENWLEKPEDIMKTKDDGNSLYQQTSNLINCNTSLNHINMIKKTKWDCPMHVTHINSQNSLPNCNIQIPCLDIMPPYAPQQQSIEFSPYHKQPQIFPNYVLDPYTIFNTPPPPLPHENQHQNLIDPFINKSVQQNKPPNLSPTSRLFKSADTKVFNLINESLFRHSNPGESIEAYTHSNKSCSRTVKSGVDLLSRIKVISNSFKNQPSKLINIKYLKQKNGKTKLKNIPTLDVKLKSVCDKNNKIIFINEQAGVTSYTLNDDLLSVPKTFPLSGKNKFACKILNSLLKKTGHVKENLIPNKFVIKNINSDITCAKADKEIELYKNMEPQVIKKVVARVKTTNGYTTVMKRQWGFKIKGLQENYDKIPATKRNIRRKGNIHRLSLMNGFSHKTKSALKRRNSINMNDDYVKRPKEKRVTFLIEGETSPISPDSEVQPITLCPSIENQKPLMKCHPFEIKNESIESTSTIQSGDLQLPLVEQQLDTTDEQIIIPIVARLKVSRRRRISSRENPIDQLERLQSRRIYKIPLSMASLSLELLKLIPDNNDDTKKVFNYHNLLVRVIVKTLGPYSKKPCQQGRIRNDDDFKYVAKKITENVLLKELQLKRVDKLKINDSTKDKVAEYVIKYMSRFGEFYKRKLGENN